jgi:hypothetical protein
MYTEKEWVLFTENGIKKKDERKIKRGKRKLGTCKVPWDEGKKGA